MNKNACRLSAAAAASLILCAAGAYAADYYVSLSGALLTESGVSVTITSSADIKADVIAASFGADGTLANVRMESCVLLEAGKTQTVTIDGITSDAVIYVWDENMTPLCGAYPVSSSGGESGDGIIHLMGTYADITGVENVTADGCVITINAAGEYIIEGSLSDGQIVVSDALGKNDEVSITLQGVDVTSSDSAPFNGAGGSIELILADGTENIFTDTSKYTGYTSEKEPKGCVYAKRDLDIGGSGTLTVSANVKNGIVSGADLKFKKGANVNVTAVNNAVKGDNGVEFTSKTGTVSIYSAEGDAVKSDAIDSDTGLLEQDKGYVTIAGGSITLNAPAGDGIQADNFCEITGGSVTITSGAEGIKANEYNVPASLDDVPVTDTDGNPVYINGKITISGGVIDIISGEDGIKASESVTVSDNADISVTAEGINSEDGSGYDDIQAGESLDTLSEDGLTTTKTIIVPGIVNISGGSVNIRNASDDAITSNGLLYISGGTITGHADCDFIKVYDYGEISGGELNIASGGDGIQSGKSLIETVSGSAVTESGYTDGNLTISGGTINITANGGSKTSVSETSDSCKGIKANTELLISGGNITIDSADDALHSNYIVTITGGSMSLASGDDGVHADYMLNLGTENGSDDDFVIDISTSYEGIEGSVINILSGTTYLYSTDDGVNAAGDYKEDGTLALLQAVLAGGSNPGGGSGGFGPNPGGDDSASQGMVYIKGGKIYVIAGGDGLDSNGSIEMSGGIVIVNGPESGGNGVFDIGDSSGCFFNVTGGTLIGEGTSNMLVSPSISGQGYATSGGSSNSGGPGGGWNPGSTSTSSGSAGSPVRVETDNGNIVFVPRLSWSYMLISTPDMSSDGAYSITTVSGYSGGTEILGKNVNGTFYGLIENAD